MRAGFAVPIYRVQLVNENSHRVARTRVTRPLDAARILRRYLAGADREQFVVLALYVKLRPIGLHTVSIGCLDATVVHPRELFKVAILSNAASIIVAHNHPSGDPTPSPEDIAVTKRLAEAGRILGIEVLDHLILGDTHVSLKERGLL